MTKQAKKKRSIGHWSERSPKDLRAKIAIDFISQLEDRMESAPTPIKRKELAEKLQVTQSAVSQKLNNPDNLELNTIAVYAQALGANATVIVYDKTANPVNPELFVLCWKEMGKPTNFLEWQNINRAVEQKAFWNDETSATMIQLDDKKV